MIERITPGTLFWNLHFAEHIQRYNFAIKYIKNKEVLDVGSGMGYGSFHLSKNKAKKVIGIDISEEAINHSRKKYNSPNLIFKKMNVLNLDNFDKKFDVVTAFEIIEHLRDQNEFLEKIKMSLKKEGICIISTPNKNIISPGLKKPLNKYHKIELSPEEFKSLLKNHFHEFEIFGQKLKKGSEQLFEKNKALWVRIIPKKLRNLIPLKLKYIMSKYIPAYNKKLNVQPTTKNFLIDKNIKNALQIIGVCKKPKNIQ